MVFLLEAEESQDRGAGRSGVCSGSGFWFMAGAFLLRPHTVEKEARERLWGLLGITDRRGQLHPRDLVASRAS